MIIQFLVIFTLAMFFFWLTYVKIKNIPFRFKSVFYILLTILAFPGFLIPFYYAHLFDNQAWYYNFRSINHIEFLLVLTSPLLASLAHKFKNLKSVFILFAIILTFLPYAKNITRPLDVSQLKNKIKDGVTIQSSSGTCGPSALAAILRKHGIEKTEKELAIACHTTKTGTEVWNIKRYLKSIGIKSEFIINKKTTPPSPAIAGVIVSQTFGHFISIIDKKNQNYTLGDSMWGKIKVPAPRISKIYTFTGFYLKIYFN